MNEVDNFLLRSCFFLLFQTSKNLMLHYCVYFCYLEDGMSPYLTAKQFILTENLYLCHRPVATPKPSEVFLEIVTLSVLDGRP